MDIGMMGVGIFMAFLQAAIPGLIILVFWGIINS